MSPCPIPATITITPRAPPIIVLFIFGLATGLVEGKLTLRHILLITEDFSKYMYVLDYLTVLEY